MSDSEEAGGFGFDTSSPLPDVMAGDNPIPDDATYLEMGGEDGKVAR